MDQQRSPKGTRAAGRFAGTWPGIAHEAQDWRGEPYESALVPEIAGIVPVLTTRTQALVEQATMDMVRFDAELGEDAPAAALLVQGEAAASSRIENINAGAHEIALALLAGIWEAPDTSASRVSANVRAHQTAVDLSEDLSLKSIAVIHFALLELSDRDIAGGYRTSPGWIRGTSPLGADYVPPGPNRVLPGMNDLVNFMDRDDIPVLTQAAVAHAQFETIHPFADGNGRAGRAIVHALLQAKGITRDVTVPLSAGLMAAGARTYFAALDEYRAGNITPIVELFAEASLRATHLARELVQNITSIEKGYRSRTGEAPPSVRSLLWVLPRWPAVTAETLAENGAVSLPTAYRAIGQLEAAGILVEARKVRGASAWVAPDMIAAMDEFSERSRLRH